ncbi:hypothetical protein ACTFIU_000693, partial [Dictyostelium citrinum]
KKQASKKQSVREKPILARLKLVVGCGNSVHGTTIRAKIYGQYGIDRIEFFNDFNTETKELFETGMALRDSNLNVVLLIKTRKTLGNHRSKMLPRIEGLFGNVQPLVVNNTMLIVEAATTVRAKQ